MAKHDNRNNTHYVVETRGKGLLHILSGWEASYDAKDYAEDSYEVPTKVLTRSYLVRQGLDPKLNDSWGNPSNIPPRRNPSPGIPSRNKIIEWMDTSKLHLGDKAATIARQAMEWAEGAEPKPTLEQYYNRLVFEEGLGQGFQYHSLDSYRSRDREDAALKIMDIAMETHGVEYIKSHQDDYHDAYGISYLNTGDTYAGTILYDHADGTWRLGTWGDEVEHDDTYNKGERFGDDSDY
jgi:hypothetical protein